MGIGDAISVDTGTPGLTERTFDRASAVYLLPLAGILASELFLFFGHTSYALGGHLVTLMVSLVAPMHFTDEALGFRAIALVPLFRLVNLGMPVFFELTLLWFPLIYGPFIPGLYLLAKRYHPPADPDFWWRRGALLFVPLVLPLAAVLGTIEYSIIHPAALIPSWSATGLLTITVVMIGFVGLVEELLFRGILQRTFQHRLGRWSGVLLASALFGLMHSGYGTPAEVVFAGVIGLIFGLIYDWTDSLALISVLHGVLNVFLFAILPLGGAAMLPFLSA